MDALLDASSPCTVQESYALCRALAKTHYENFTVGSWLLPKATRKHFYAIYAFCRFVDDLGDELRGDRMRALDFWQREVDLCYDGAPTHPYTIALRETIGAFDIPRDPFDKLIEANRMDQSVSRYRSYDDLDFYCQHSANPVGRLVLYVCGLPGPGAPAPLGPHVHRAAAGQLLAGRGQGPRHGADIHPTGGHGALWLLGAGAGSR